MTGRSGPQRVTLASMASGVVMGQQAYEQSILLALRELAMSDLEFESLGVASLRSQHGRRRLPWKAVERSPMLLARLFGRVAYRGAGLIHRLDLRLPPAPGVEVVTVHDLPGLRFPDEGALPPFFRDGARHASAVIVPSQFAQVEVVELLGLDPGAVHVIPYGLDPTHREDPGRACTGALEQLPRPFVVHAAGATTRKNLASLAGAWAEVAARLPDAHLLLCGPPDPRRSSLFLGLPRTHLLGKLAAQDVSWLMRHAAAVVVPSTYEGFGLPALEGMAAGAPVVASRRGALPEVCADAALLVEPDSDSLAEGLLRVLTDAGLAGRLRTQGPVRARDFDWARAAEAHVGVYRRALAVR